MAYSEKVIEHYENPRNVGSFDKDDPNVGTGLVGAPACGDVMKLQIKINDAGDHRGREVQDLRLRLGDRVVVAGDRVGQGHDDRSGDGDQEHPDRRGAEPAAGEDSLLGAGRGRHQGRHRRLQGEARRQDGRDGGDAKGRRAEEQHGHRRSATERSPRSRRRPRSGRRCPRGCASASAAAAARASRTSSSGRTASRGRRTRFCRSRTARVRVFVDPKSYLYLDGSTLDLRRRRMMGRGFKFENPNVKGSCGCGESVQF